MLCQDNLSRSRSLFFLHIVQHLRHVQLSDGRPKLGAFACGTCGMDLSVMGSGKLRGKSQRNRGGEVQSEQTSLARHNPTILALAYAIPVKPRGEASVWLWPTEPGVLSSPATHPHTLRMRLPLKQGLILSIQLGHQRLSRTHWVTGSRAAVEQLVVETALKFSDFKGSTITSRTRLQHL